jgi:hypothetical protein
MFGHERQDHPAPSADGALTNDDAGMGTPQINDTAAGDFIDDAPAPTTIPAVTHPDNVTTNVDEPTETEDDTASVPPADEPPVAAATPAPAVPQPTTAVDSDQLLDIKQQALQQLTPLVDHLDQSPEEKFRTTMMMIQAADNHELIQVAYDAAQAITDEKTRAQALLDIVNEINYFTQHNNEQTPEAA